MDARMEQSLRASLGQTGHGGPGTDAAGRVGTDFGRAARGRAELGRMELGRTESAGTAVRHVDRPLATEPPSTDVGLLPERFRRRHSSSDPRLLQMPRGTQRRLGEILGSRCGIGSGDIDRILAHQADSGLKFGQAAIALRIASPDDVVWALSQQFDYAGADLSLTAISPELVTAADPFGADAEQFRLIRSQLLFGALGRDSARRALAVVSANRGDGKSYFAANLALSLSQLRGQTLLIDADLRTPRMQALFDVPSSTGLSLVLSGRLGVMQALQNTGYPGLVLLGAGPVPPNPVELLHGGELEVLIDELLLQFAYIIVDTPAATHGADAQVVAAHCGTALVLARQGASRLDDIAALTDALQAASVQTAGVLVNEH